MRENIGKAEESLYGFLVINWTKSNVHHLSYEPKKGVPCPSDKGLIFPFQLCREIEYLERVNFKIGTLLNLSALVKTPYRYLLFLNFKYYDDIKKLYVFREMHGDIWQVMIEFDLRMAYFKR